MAVFTSSSVVFRCYTVISVGWLLSFYISVEADSNKGIAEKCRTCTDIVNNINEGIKKTSKSNFGGGNTKWEEKNLGSYAVSETRFLEILEGVCSDKKECHQMLEEHEETLEFWWFKIHPKDEKEDLQSYFCINKLKVCCPSGTFGPDCQPCSGGKDNPCGGNGKCQGNGTRSGQGGCDCDLGYTGELCEKCADNYYEESRNAKQTVCKVCHKACKKTCSGPGPENCDECVEGWLQTDNGCQDVNECEGDPCEEDQFCSNTPGSYNCLACHGACAGCFEATASDCEECAENYYKDDKTCKACHVSCTSGCSGGSAGDCNACHDGWLLNKDGHCQDINECSLESSPCDQDSYCINTEGSYKCSTCHYACNGCSGAGADLCNECKPGYRKDSNGLCVDDDECDVNTTCPGQNALCINTPGSYRCDCVLGYKLVNGVCVEESKNKQEKTSTKQSSQFSEKSTVEKKQNKKKSEKSKETNDKGKKKKEFSKTKKSKKSTSYGNHSDYRQYWMSLAGFVLISFFVKHSLPSQIIITVMFWIYLFWFTLRFDKIINL